ncbi:DUF3450 family protein [Thiohalorhabdus methylotrophus]|uniref:DUF3450 family protein n=1 Tax=Thiohalorhabdus methylotrophus TaxID=3242694 RepID=A0ABV4TU08_9GAMM
MAIRSFPVRLLGGQLLCLLLMQPASAAGESLDRLAEKLVNLRGEVEELNSRLDSLRDQHKNEMASLSRRKSDLQSRIQQRQVQVDELRTNLREIREEAQKAGVEAEALEPKVADAIVTLKTRVRRGLPFKVAERVGELEDIRKQMATGVLTPHKAAKRLWTFYEDEIRLAEENGIYQQTVTVNGEEKLADVARVGMVMLFFRTPASQYGRAVRSDGGWTYRVYRRDAAREQVKNLFASFRKQVRTGYFTIPNALTGTEDQ